jgi:hypothetical protein
MTAVNRNINVALLLQNLEAGGSIKPHRKIFTFWNKQQHVY